MDTYIRPLFVKIVFSGRPGEEKEYTNPRVATIENGNLSITTGYKVFLYPLQTQISRIVVRPRTETRTSSEEARKLEIDVTDNTKPVVMYGTVRTANGWLVVTDTVKSEITYFAPGTWTRLTVNRLA